MTLLITLDHNSPIGLQHQIRQKLVEAILSGVLPAGHKMMSSRKLANQLNVARNTVVLAYNKLVDEGYLVSHERSGLYVNAHILEGRVGFTTNSSEPKKERRRWQQKIKIKGEARAYYESPSDWQNYPYPFLDGHFDSSLYPITQWQEATRLAFGGLQTLQFETEQQVDDAMLIEQIRTKILPRRGINALSEEILITSGSHHSMYLLAQLLTNSDTLAAVENPGSPALRRCLQLTGCQLSYSDVDEHGLIINKSLDKADLIFITPSHQQPTAVTMPIERRLNLLEKAEANKQIIIEDDSESEHNYFGNPSPALRSLDKHNNVIYVSALHKALAPGLGLGFIVASPTVIAEAKRLRRLMVGNPPKSNQRTAAFFISLGHYDTYLMRINKTFSERWNVLRDALNHYLPKAIYTLPNQGGTAFWIKCPSNIPVTELVQRAAEQGILIEPVADYYVNTSKQQTDSKQLPYFRMGVTSIRQDKIREGVERLAKLIRDYSDKPVLRLNDDTRKPLSEQQMQSLLPGITIHSKTVYGAPCTIKLLADGQMQGKAGHNDEEQDAGNWWIEEGKWYRQWQQWAFAELAGYYITIEDDKINWFNHNGRLVDSAHFSTATQQSTEKLV